jgi:hypothetical protein
MNTVAAPTGIAISLAAADDSIGAAPSSAPPVSLGPDLPLRALDVQLAYVRQDSRLADVKHGLAVIAAAVVLTACVREVAHEGATTPRPPTEPVIIRLRAEQATPPVELFVEDVWGAEGRCTASAADPGAPGTYSCTPVPFVVREGGSGGVGAAFLAPGHTVWVYSTVEFRGARAFDFEWNHGDFGLWAGPRPDGGTGASDDAGVDAGSAVNPDAGPRGLSKAVIASVIKLGHAYVKDCYELELKTTPDLNSAATARFFIATNGAVTGVAVELELGSPRFAQCLGKTIRALRYPSPQGGDTVSVVFPYVFRPMGSTDAG